MSLNVIVNVIHPALDRLDLIRNPKSRLHVVLEKHAWIILKVD